MRVTGALTISLVVCLIWIGTADARPPGPKQGAEAETLVDLGVFATVVGNPSGFGTDTQVYELNQRTASSLEDSNWLPYICSAGVDLKDTCVHTIQVDIKATRPYNPVYLHFFRAGAEVDMIEWDGKKVGGLAVVSTVSGEEGHWVSAMFELGMITPQKTHTLRIWSPSSGEGDGVHVMAGVKVMGMPLSGKK